MVPSFLKGGLHAMHRIARVWLLAATIVTVLMPVAVAQQAVNSDSPPPELSAAAKHDANGSAPIDDHFIIGPDDLLAISVWKEPDISRAVPVRADGKISLPLVGELQAAGRTPQLLETEIRERLKSYMSEPEVTVMVQETHSRSFNILGEVARPGAYPINKPVTVLDAIAIAGGFRDFAKRKSIYVLRTQADGRQQRIPFNYKEATNGKKPEMNLLLRPSDTIVVP